VIARYLVNSVVHAIVHQRSDEVEESLEFVFGDEVLVPVPSSRDSLADDRAEDAEREGLGDEAFLDPQQVLAGPVVVVNLRLRS